MKRFRYWILFPLLTSFFLPLLPTYGQEGLPSLIRRIESSIVVIATFNKEGKVLGQGSGFFISKEGDVISNHHVLQGAVRAEVKTKAGEVYSVKKILAEDQEGDLIRLSVDIPEEDVRPLALSASPPEVGERILVIGTPLGLERTVSDGIVSAVRDVPEFGKIIQVTAPISQGSSGSPVINMKGEVIGIATFYVVTGQNLNFAIPSERIAKLSLREEQSLPDREQSRIEEWRTSAAGLYTTGLRYLWVEDCQRALPFFLETIRRKPDYGEAHFQIGYCQGKLGRYQEAIEPYRQAIRIKPRDPESHNNLCVAYGMVGRYAEAVASCRQAVLLKSDLFEGYNNLGWAYHKLGRYGEAIEACKKAIQISPDFVMAHYNLGNNYLALGKYEEASESYKEVIRRKFDYAEGHLNLGVAYNHMKRYEDAIQSYKQAIGLKPALAEAYLDLGMTHLKLGDRGAAIEIYTILRKIDKDLANKLFNLIYE